MHFTASEKIVKSLALLALVLLCLVFLSINRESLQRLGKKQAVSEGKLKGGFVYAGSPVFPTRGKEKNSHLKLLENRGYLSLYDETYKNPRWVAYRLSKDCQLAGVKRRGSFQADRRVAGTYPRDYSHSGYQRGHLAPSHAIARCYGSEAQRETFLMSNISPQRASLNGGLWKDLEERSESYAKAFAEVWVLTGPVFRCPSEELTRRFAKNQKPLRCKGNLDSMTAGVILPKAFFKILVDLDAGHPRVLGFVIPQDAPPQGDLKHFLVSIDEIEALTGLDFFSDISEAEEKALERKRETKLWSLPKVSTSGYH